MLNTLLLGYLLHRVVHLAELLVQGYAQVAVMMIIAVKMFVCEEYMPPWSDVAPLLSTTSASSYDYFEERCAPSCDLPTPDNHVYPVGNYNLTLSVSAPSFWAKHPTVVPTPAFWAGTTDTATITAKLTLDLAGIIIPVASSDIDFFSNPRCWLDQPSS